MFSVPLKCYNGLAVMLNVLLNLFTIFRLVNFSHGLRLKRTAFQKLNCLGSFCKWLKSNNIFSLIFWRTSRHSFWAYFLTLTPKQSIFGLLIPKLNLKWLFASYTLIFMTIYIAGLNTLRTPIHEFHDFLKKNGNLPYSKKKHGLNLETFQFCWKRVSLRENVSLWVS